MTSRRLRVLLENLPPESATWTALRNSMSDEELAEQAEKGEPEKARWSQMEQLLAAVVDGLRRVEYVLILANSDSKARKPDPPEPVRRPGAKPLRAKRALSEANAERLFSLINSGAA
jgi:hypothetical protein